MPSLPQSRKYSSPKVHVSIIICEFGYMSATGSERGEAGKPNLPRQLLIRHTTCSTLLTLICRVVARSVCRCRLTVFGDCVCGEWSWKKKRITLKYLCYWRCVVTFPSQPRPTSKWVQLEFTTYGHTSSPSRHQAEGMSSWARPHLHACFLVLLVPRSQRPPVGWHSRHINSVKCPDLEQVLSWMDQQRRPAISLQQNEFVCSNFK